ncbi:MAG TPA: hypothetical protein VIX80_10880, partial [Candidatus Kapabacteria bacterium]
FMQIAGLQEIVSVPAGSFTCIRYDSHYQSLNAVNMSILEDNILGNHYVSVGIGRVKSISFISSSREELVLVSYRF